MLANLAPALTAVRLSLHVLGATVWVGGQLTVAGLLGTVRKLGTDAPRQVARAFARLQWPAYFLVVGTGFWNAAEVGKQPHNWHVVLGVKIAVVAIAGLAAFIHQRSRSKAALAAFGAVAGLASLAALALGVLLAG